MEKKYTFLLNETAEGGTILRTVMDTSWHYKNEYYLSRIKRGWYRHLEPLYNELGVELNPILRESLFGVGGYYKEMIDSMRNVYLGIVIACLGMAIDLWGEYNGWGDNIGLYLLPMGAVTAIFSWTNASSAKKNLSLFEPEKRDEYLRGKSSPNRVFMILAVASLVSIVGLGYWINVQPSVNVYLGQGFSFEYPRTWSTSVEHAPDVPENLFEAVSCKGGVDAILVLFYGEQSAEDVQRLRSILFESYEEQFTSIQYVDEDVEYYNDLRFDFSHMILTTEKGSVHGFYGFTHVEGQGRVYIVVYAGEEAEDVGSFQKLLSSFKID